MRRKKDENSAGLLVKWSGAVSSCSDDCQMARLTPRRQVFPPLDIDHQGQQQVVVVGGILGEAWPQVALEQLQVLQHKQRRVCKVDLLQLVPELFLNNVRAHFRGLLRGQPVLARDLRKVVLAVQVGDGRAGVHHGRGRGRGRAGGRRTVDAVHVEGGQAASQS